MLIASGYQVKFVIRTEDEKDQFVANLVKRRRCFTVESCHPDNEDGNEINGILSSGSGTNIHGLIYAWGLNVTEINQKCVSLPFLHICKAIVGSSGGTAPQLFVITQGVHAVNDDEITCHPSSATLFGMVKSLKNENSDLFVRYVDLELGSKSEHAVDQVMFELAMSREGKEKQRVEVVYRDNVRYEPKLMKAVLESISGELEIPSSSDRYHLVLPKSRLIQDLEFDVMQTKVVTDNHVEVKVKAYGLNFKDVLTIIKPNEEFELLDAVGWDYAGVVSRVGSGSGFSVGDRVYGVNLQGGQLPSHVIQESRRVFHIPNNMTYSEAATMPVAFITASICLITFAKMKKEDTVLIHTTGSGGVGMAALQLAKMVGAKIITTAGNTKKRAYLRSLGIEHVFHSRDTSYEQQILKATSGKGVDIVLNSITGPGFKEATLNSCAKNARFVEMSKLSIWTPDEVACRRPDVDYNVLEFIEDNTEMCLNHLRTLQELLKQGKFQPIPHVRYDALNIRQAFQYFQKSKHIGKVVCTMPDVTREESGLKVSVPVFNSESTYLITGGLGGIGFEICKWMLSLGASDVVLNGRRPPSNKIQLKIDDLNKNGFNVMVRLGDIGNYDRCKQIIIEIQGGCMKPLRGVMHCAGVLTDGFYPNQSWDNFEATFAPKVNGTWNLHNLTRNHPLEHFVMYSSITAIIGTPWQPNHAAANCFEDAFIHYRHSLGLPGTTVNWGQWSQVGVAREVNLAGIRPISVQRMLRGLEHSMKSNKIQVALTELESLPAYMTWCPTLKSIVDARMFSDCEAKSSTSGQVEADKFWRDFDGKEGRDEKVKVMAAYLKEIMRSSLRLDPDDKIGDDANIQELGVDSLVMLELKNGLQILLSKKLVISLTLLKDCHTVHQISTRVVDRIVGDDGGEMIDVPLAPSKVAQLLREDCVLDEKVTSSTSSPPVMPSQIKTIFITGTTGKLTPYIIARLHDYSTIERIVCLVPETNTQSETVTEGMDHVIDTFQMADKLDMSKVEYVPGDVTKELLGLPESKYNQLCDMIHAVIHCAAKEDYGEHYDDTEKNGTLNDIRSVNVGGTQNVIKFASMSKIKHVFYPSSIWVASGGSNKKSLSDEWPNEDAIDALLSTEQPGFLISKFVSEMLLKQANERGIPCKVFRFPWIAGESQMGRINPENNMYILRYLSFLKLSAMPEPPIPVNVVPVDICAAISMEIFLRDDAPNEVFHIMQMRPQMEQDFAKVAKEEFGKELRMLGWDAFEQLLKEDETLMELYGEQRQTGIKNAMSVGIAEGCELFPDLFYRNDKVTRLVPNHAQCIPMPMEIIRKDLSYLKASGFLDKFGI